jgi:hypothetical protein
MSDDRGAFRRDFRLWLNYESVSCRRNNDAYAQFDPVVSARFKFRSLIVR